MNRLFGDFKNKLTIEYGGISKESLLKKLKESDILLNEYAEIIFSSENFHTSSQKQSILITEITLRELGFSKGMTIPEIKNVLGQFGLCECPLEAAPYLRLKLIDQEEIKVLHPEKNKNPTGSLTIFSKILSEDINFPKGFYLRKINGQLWLRGYRCSLDYVWSPDDRFLFAINKK